MSSSEAEGIDPKYAAIPGTILNSVEGIRRTGLKIITLRDRHVKMCMPLEGNGNHLGIMYAGSLFSIGEVTGGIIPAVSLDMTDLVPLVKEVHIRFVAPAMTVVFLTAEISREKSEEIQQTAAENGKADFVLELDLKNASDDVVAHVTGTWQVRNLSKGI
ncbi:PaaI family thioesterase [bacterium]|nr:PaaI family thioesterase [bacterium]